MKRDFLKDINSKEYKDYLNELGKIPASRLNKLMHMFNCRVPKEEMDLKSDIEEKFYIDMVEEAEAHKEKYGFYPTYEMLEIEEDDPVLDIYKDE